MALPSLAQRILEAARPFVLFHTHAPTREVIRQAVGNRRSIDLDVSVDEAGVPRLGHSDEYYAKSGEDLPATAPFDEAIEIVAASSIPVILDCKHPLAWPHVERILEQLGAHRCLVHAFATDLRGTPGQDEPDYETEWSPITRLAAVKEAFPSVTLSASCKFLPPDALLSPAAGPLLARIRDTLAAHRVDTVCLNLPDVTMSDRVLEFFLAAEILPHVGVDGIDRSRLTRPYVGETDVLASASEAREIGY